LVRRSTENRDYPPGGSPPFWHRGRSRRPDRRGRVAVARSGRRLGSARDGRPPSLGRRRGV